ncbi:MAG TPA: hypothetical protein VIR98_03645 [Candidatus Paceibacterota bacterium]|jgi:hypothetical protein
MKKLSHYKAALPIILSLVAVFLAMPHAAHAGLLDILATPVDFVGRLVSVSMEYIILPLAAGVLYLAGQIMDSAITFGLHTGYIFSLSPAINLGWSIVRDLINICFIFVLIYISLGTIVQGLRFGTASKLRAVIIAAILINFSLFFTKAVVDASNVFGQWLYGGVLTTLAENSIDKTKPVSLSGLITKRLGIIAYWTNNNTKPNASDGSQNWLSDPSQSIVGRFLRLAIVLIATYMFLYISVIFVARAITILFLLVFSPIGFFIGEVLPSLAPYSKQWRNELEKAATFPVAFLLMLYISLQFINSLGILNLSTLMPSVKVFGSEFKIGDLFQYVLIIMLLKATLEASKSYSGQVGGMLGDLASGLGKVAVNAGMGVASGGTALLARGGIAAFYAEKGKGKDAFKETFKAGVPIYNKFTGGDLKKNLKDYTTKTLKDASFDIRNLKMPGMGKDTLATQLGNVTGININTKTAKEYKEQKKEFQEEVKIEKAQKDLLEDIDKLLAEETALEHAKGTPTEAAEQKAVWDRQDRINKNLGSLSNKQLEKFRISDLTNPKFLEQLSASQVEYLTEKSELSDGDKAKIRQARTLGLSSIMYETEPDPTFPAGSNRERLRMVKGAPVSKPKGSVDVTKIAKTAKKLNKKELENLPSYILSSPDFARSLDSEKLETIMKSDSYGGGTKGRIKQARYEKLKDLIDKGAVPDDIKAEISAINMNANEIAKLGEEMFAAKRTFFIPGGGTREEWVPKEEMIDALVARGNTDVFDKMISNDLHEDIREKIRDYIDEKAAAPSAGGKNNYKKISEWFTKGRGVGF